MLHNDCPKSDVDLALGRSLYTVCLFIFSNYCANTVSTDVLKISGRGRSNKSIKCSTPPDCALHSLSLSLLSLYKTALM